jgi:uncharacterized protein (TIGR00255 family)
MTGFGAATLERDGLSIRVEVRSVNHRHLQSKFRLPAEFGYLESEAEAILRKRVSRGSVSLTATIARLETPSTVSFDADVAKSYHKKLSKLASELGIDGGMTIESLVTLPGVLVTRSQSDPDEREAKLILKVTSEAIGELVTMRETEGASLARDLQKNATAVDRTVARIEKRMPRVVREHHASLKRRVADLVGDARPGPDPDLARELALLADRLDVSEEISRLKSHLEQLDSLLTKGGTVGRQLDFLAQEFFREANTIGSKCNDAQVAHAVVQLKTSIERLREQVQNVE